MQKINKKANRENNVIISELCKYFAAFLEIWPCFVWKFG